MTRRVNVCTWRIGAPMRPVDGARLVSNVIRSTAISPPFSIGRLAVRVDGRLATMTVNQLIFVVMRVGPRPLRPRPPRRLSGVSSRKTPVRLEPTFDGSTGRRRGDGCGDGAAAVALAGRSVGRSADGSPRPPRARRRRSQFSLNRCPVGHPPRTGHSFFRSTVSSLPPHHTHTRRCCLFHDSKHGPGRRRR